jgi:predicted nucleic acid-binding protein
VARYLLDSNVLVYAFDGQDPAKRSRALEVIERASAAGGVLPAQAMGEFARVAIERLRPRMTPAAVTSALESLEGAFGVIPLTPAVVLEAVRGVRDHRFSYYDAQIWAAARLGQVRTVLSEDFAAGATVDGVTFVDPFAAGFDPVVL